MEVDAPAAPDVETPPAADGTPDESPEQADQPGAAGSPADQPPAAPPDPRLAQAEYTRSQQAFSSLREQLGLPRTATRDDVIAEVARLRAGPESEDDDEPEAPEDPRVAEYQRIAFDAQIQTTRAIYGDEFVTEGLNLINSLRTSDDPHELMTSLAAFVSQRGAAPATETGEPDEGEPDPDAVPAPAGVLGDDRGPSAQRQPISESAARREPGTVGAVRGIFEGLGIASRGRS